MHSLAVQVLKNDRRIFWGMFGVFTVLVFLYVYFLIASVTAVAMRKSNERSLLALTAVIAEKESVYVASGKNINLALAHQKGFVDITVPEYIARADVLREITRRE